MIAYVLNKEISGEKILQDVQKLIVDFKHNNNNKDKVPILYIDIKTITREDTTLIPKIEYHSLEPDCHT
jgi:hypothetical protein